MSERSPAAEERQKAEPCTAPRPEDRGEHARAEDEGQRGIGGKTAVLLELDAAHGKVAAYENSAKARGRRRSRVVA
jgi:hypothetical protein